MSPALKELLDPFMLDLVLGEDLGGYKLTCSPCSLRCKDQNIELAGIALLLIDPPKVNSTTDTDTHPTRDLVW